MKTAKEILNEKFKDNLPSEYEGKIWDDRLIEAGEAYHAQFVKPPVSDEEIKELSMDFNEPYLNEHGSFGSMCYEAGFKKSQSLLTEKESVDPVKKEMIELLENVADYQNNKISVYTIRDRAIKILSIYQESLKEK